MSPPDFRRRGKRSSSEPGPPTSAGTTCAITFASRLVQHGVPLNTVRDLLGHGSVGMSLRYAHLAPDQRREAVAKLNEKLLTLTMRLQWEGLPVASGYRVDSIVVREGQELASQIPLSGNLPVLELRL